MISNHLKLTVCAILLCSTILGCRAEKSKSNAGGASSQKSDDKPELSDESSITTPMDIVVLPFYDSTGPKIELDQFGSELAAADSSSIGDVMKKMEQQWNTLRVETMYVLAIRLYDLGLKDEAVYWFYSARFRNRLFAGLQQSSGSENDPTQPDLLHAYKTFDQKAGIYIDGYAFGELEMLKGTFKKVLTEYESIPPFAQIYPKVSFIPSEEWQGVRTTTADGIKLVLKNIEQNGDQIKAARKKSGMEGRY